MPSVLDAVTRFYLIEAIVSLFMRLALHLCDTRKGLSLQHTCCVLDQGVDGAPIRPMIRLCARGWQLKSRAVRGG